MMKNASLAVAAICAFVAGPAWADITIFDVPGAVQPAENVLFNNVPPPTGNLAFGRTNQTSTSVTFQGTEPLVTPAQGQARLAAADGGFNNLQFYLTTPQTGFTEVEFNINGSAGTSVQLNFTDQFGNITSGTFALVNGQNFFSARATNGEFITNVAFTTTADVADLRQVRVGGFGNFGAIPEPATWAMMIGGFAFVGAVARRRGAGKLLVVA